MQPGPEFRQLFHSFDHTVFRLEVRDRYDAPYENESVRKFLAGEPDDLSWSDSWLSMVRSARIEGRTYSRARVVSVPLTDYSRFGLWASQFTVAAGENIRYLTRNQAQEIRLPNHDYWLFDSRKLMRVHFDENDRFLGGEVIDDSAEIVQHNYWRDAAWHHAVERDDFAAKQGFGRIERP
ncbi:MAG: DUF6879 family protein [Pseudonocardiaceae bacterium]